LYDQSGSTKAFKNSIQKSISIVEQGNSFIKMEDQSSFERSDALQDQAKAFKKHKTLHSRESIPRKVEKVIAIGEYSLEAP